MDVLDVCRLCLSRGECFINIFDENVDLGFNVEKSIQDLLQFEVKKGNGVPYLTCSTCIKELNHFRMFKRRCIDSKVTFEKRLCERQQETDVCSSSYGERAAVRVISGSKGEKCLDEGGEARGGSSEPGVEIGSSVVVGALAEMNAPGDSVDAPSLERVKPESGFGQMMPLVRGVYQRELPADDAGFPQCTPCDGWSLEKSRERCVTLKGEAGLLDAEATSGMSEADVSLIVMVKREAAVEDLTQESQDLTRMPLIRGSAKPLPVLNKYTKDDLKKALEEVRAGNAIRVVGRAYGIPESTIRGHLSLGQRRQKGAKRKESFNAKEMKKLSGFLLSQRDSGEEPRKLCLSHKYPRTKRKAFGSPPPADGVDWFDCFLERLTAGVPEKLRPAGMVLQTTTARKNGYTEHQMLQAVRAVMAGRPIRQVGREMGIAESTIRLRIKKMRSGDS